MALNTQLNAPESFAYNSDTMSQSISHSRSMDLIHNCLDTPQQLKVSVLTAGLIILSLSLVCLVFPCPVA